MYESDIDLGYRASYVVPWGSLPCVCVWTAPSIPDLSLIPMGREREETDSFILADPLLVFPNPLQESLASKGSGGDPSLIKIEWACGLPILIPRWGQRLSFCVCNKLPGEADAPWDTLIIRSRDMGNWSLNWVELLSPQKIMFKSSPQHLWCRQDLCWCSHFDYQE